MAAHGKQTASATTWAPRSASFDGIGCASMAEWVKPAYSRTRVDNAGRAIAGQDVSAEERALAIAVINNWRSAHGFPLNTLQMTLRRWATKVDADPTVAQRIKRLPSIRHKLERIPGMKLSRMQDLGGCRAVVNSAETVDALVDAVLHKSRMKQELVRHDPYVERPKPSGYRGVHLVYRYRSDTSHAWDGLQIEMQIRSRLQHAWATAVETAGIFVQQALKSSWGDQNWLRFFALMSSALAIKEGTAPVPGTPEDRDELKRELTRYAAELDVINRLAAFGTAVSVVEQAGSGGGHLFLLELDATQRRLFWRPYDNAVAAGAAYDAIEQTISDQPGKDAVLVSVESLAALRRAYPNYFLDTRVFVQSVEEAIA